MHTNPCACVRHADPHGTHRTCLAAVFEALKRLHGARPWMDDCWVWLYRGAWQVGTGGWLEGKLLRARFHT